MCCTAVTHGRSSLASKTEQINYELTKDTADTKSSITMPASASASDAQDITTDKSPACTTLFKVKKTEIQHTPTLHRLGFCTAAAYEIACFRTLGDSLN